MGSGSDNSFFIVGKGRELSPSKPLTRDYFNGNYYSIIYGEVI
jgi:hypothetical protein